MTKKILLGIGGLICIVLFFFGYEICMHFYPSKSQSKEGTILRYNFYAVIIAILSYAATENRNGLLRLVFGFVFGLAIFDIPFRLLGIYHRENSDYVLVVLSIITSIVLYTPHERNYV